MKNVGINTDLNDIMEQMDVSGVRQKSTTHRVRSQRSIKVSDLVTAALQYLNEPKGSSPKEIVNYLQREYNCPSKAISRCVYTVLKRGVDYGILKRAPGNNYILAPLNDEDVLEAGCRRKRRRHKSCKRKKRSCSRRKRRCSRKRKRSACKRKRKRSCRRKRSACRRRKTACRRRRRRSACKKRRKSCRRRSKPKCPRRCKIEEYLQDLNSK